MNTSIYNLAFALDKDGYLGIYLMSDSSLYNLDQTIKGKYKNTKDVRKEFDREISEFCLVNMKLIQAENKRNHNNRTGRIVILEKVYNNNRLIDIRQIKVLYQDNFLPNRKKCASKVKEKLQDDEILKELYTRKHYLLSQNEKDLLRLYFKYNNKKYKNSAIFFFVDRIKTDKSHDAYYTCRMLTNLCELDEKKSKVSNMKVKKVLEEECQINEKSPYQEIVVEQMTMDKLLKKEGNNNV